MNRKPAFPIPPWILALDGVGTAFIVLGMLAALGLDFGLPALAQIWPLLIVLGVALMLPMAVWAVRRARQAAKERG